ncbi:hypothetical protein [Methylobacterium oxalidis]|uniref:Uncharacterized protein n=1 Tax=Methylobacterium oxalidis TaxID=944322 RepID=A0A512J947_9HYPH|nr:hypothetical protein [Methylobacterium oxalidis]GEP06491.1 hypothetical protein MOX02_45290 [Methylobacterium oxalidis]GJE30692.1 hypothetical protein LDDCCGHA_0861 [Methylobacterium oxalidis]GLS63931.1 hypothetical protein GCM10007888_23120 [Methylobacterium oxalidis]
MRTLAQTLSSEALEHLITGLAEAALEHASEHVPVLMERLWRLEMQARADGVSSESISAISRGRRLLGDRRCLIVM